MENDLISRETLVAAIQEYQMNLFCNKLRLGEIDLNSTSAIANVERLVCEAPSIDAVEVVRCKDCEYNEGVPMPVGFLYCSRTDSVVKEDDYCSYGWRA